jgi:hypothetical protein
MIREGWLCRLVFRSSLPLHFFVLLGDLRALVVNLQLPAVAAGQRPAGAARAESEE